ncbi:MAG TPA: glycosyltransferase, partial [Phycisphaerae bacterium]|nr:glycosyltransferase [Phycisphaerae bacterium]
YLARICPEKGLHQLCEALRILHARGRKCRLKVAGYLGDSDRSYFEEVKKSLRDKGLLDLVEFLGEVDRAGKFRMLRSIDAFSVPTTYREAKGLYVLEAMSQAVPVVQPDHGSFPELIAATGGGILFKPGDAAALADAIGVLMDNPGRRADLGRSGCETVRSRFTDEMMADEAWAMFEEVVREAT